MASFKPEHFPIALGAAVLFLIIAGGNGGALLWLVLVGLLVMHFNGVLGKGSFSAKMCFDPHSHSKI